MAGVYDEIASRTIHLRDLYEQLLHDNFKENPNVRHPLKDSSSSEKLPELEKLSCYRLHDSIGLHLSTVVEHPAGIIPTLAELTLAGECKLRTGLAETSAQVKIIKDRRGQRVSLGTISDIYLDPRNSLQRKFLPPLLLADLGWNYLLLDRSCLEELEKLLGTYKQTRVDATIFYFDDKNLDWLVRVADFITVFARTEKYGLICSIRENLKVKEAPQVLREKLKELLKKEIEILDNADEGNFTAARRKLLLLESATDQTLMDIMQSIA